MLLYSALIPSDTNATSSRLSCQGLALSIIMGIQRSGQMVPAASYDPKNPLLREFGQLQVLDDLIRLRAADIVQHPILAYPRLANHAACYDYYSGQILNGLISQAVTKLMYFDFQTVGALRPHVLTCSDIFSLAKVNQIDCRPPRLVRSRYGSDILCAEPTRLHCHDALAETVGQGVCVLVGGGGV